MNKTKTPNSPVAWVRSTGTVGHHPSDEFEGWYQAAEFASGGKIVGERESMRKYWAAAFTPHEAAKLYIAGIGPIPFPILPRK